MKKLLVLFLMCILIGCGTKQKDENSEEFALMGYPGISENGIYHIVDTDFDKEVYFYDMETGKDVPLCSKVNCNHKNKDCDAYQLMILDNTKLSFAPLVYKEKLYYIYEYSPEAKTILAKSDMDGRNREIIKEINDLSILTTGMLYDDKFWFSDNAFEVDEEGSIISTGSSYGLQYLDLYTLETTILKDKGDIQYVIRGAYDNQPYFIELDAKKTTFSLMKKDLKSNELVEVLEDFPNINSSIIESAIYGYDTNTSQIYKTNLNDLKKEDIMKCEIPEGYKLLSVVQTDPYGMMTLILVNEQKQTAEMYVDLLEKKILDGEQRIIYERNDVHYVIDQKGIITKQ